jgi:exonuclease SbcD
VHVHSGYGSAEGVEVPTSAGPLAVAMVPYLEPSLAPPGFMEPEVAAVAGGGDAGGGDAVGGERSDHGEPDTGATGSRVRRRPTHEAVIARALARARAGLPPGLPSLVLSHAFVARALRSDSERDIAVGDSALVAAEVYSGFDYVALGHLHRPQVVRAEGCIRYSGSPLAYSFSESGPKQVVVAELSPADAGWSVDARTIDVGVGRRAVTVTGTIDELLAGEPNASDWVRAELTDTLRPSEPMARLRKLFPHLAEIDWVGDGSTPRQGRTATDVTRRAPLELAGEFWAERMGEPLADDLAAILAGAFVELEGDERGAA